jgi:integrase
MSDTLISELKTLKDRRITEWEAKGKETIPEWIFCNQERNPPDMVKVIKRHFLKRLEQGGIRRIRFHDLRHTFATLLIMQGESLAYVKDQLGHSSINLTVDTYTHWIPGSNRDAVNKLPRIESNVPKTLVRLGAKQVRKVP